MLVHVWHIDMTAMSNMDTPMMRITRGLLEALVILVIADLLWQVVRVLIDARLAGDAPPIDALDDNQLRRQARLRTFEARQVLANQWALHSTHTAAQLKEILRQFLSERDRIVVTEVGAERASRRALCNLSDL